jgi:hypothetical protein
VMAGGDAKQVHGLFSSDKRDTCSMVVALTRKSVAPWRRMFSVKGFHLYSVQ